jgi:hypothetical protein
MTLTRREFVVTAAAGSVLVAANGRAQHVKFSGYDLWRVEVR